MITLEEFILETVNQITAATRKFHEATQGDGDAPRPQLLGPTVHSGTGKSCVAVEFDVAVAAEEGGKKGGGAAIKIASVLQGEGAVERTAASSTDNRVKFTLGLFLPDVQ